jgi:5-oxoprolinase (ATP-hydrolysing) subunit A
MTTIDLNCDLGEGFGAWEMGNDADMIGLATSVNIACGFHAGDSETMRTTVDLAKARGVNIGAHPGYRDLHGFGRRPFPGMKASEIENMVAYQIGALQAIATMAGHKVTHVKVHGALSNVACDDDMTARALAAGIKGVDRNLIFVVLANSRLVSAGEAAGLPMVHEGFAAPTKTTARWCRAANPARCCTMQARSHSAWFGWCRTARSSQSPAR